MPEFSEPVTEPGLEQVDSTSIDLLTNSVDQRHLLRALWEGTIILWSVNKKRKTPEMNELETVKNVAKICTHNSL